MSSAELTSNYFELFDLPVNFEVDVKELAERYRKLQSTVHPDKYANAGDLERRLSVQRSAHINEAFQTLKNPLRRARYMLQLNGIDLSTDTDTAMDPQFLMQQMELRENLEEAKHSADPAESVSRLSADIERIIKGIISELKNVFTANDANDLMAARDCVRRLQFMTRLQEEAHSLEEQFY